MALYQCSNCGRNFDRPSKVRYETQPHMFCNMACRDAYWRADNGDVVDAPDDLSHQEAQVYRYWLSHVEQPEAALSLAQWAYRDQRTYIRLKARAVGKTYVEAMTMRLA